MRQQKQLYIYSFDNDLKPFWKIKSVKTLEKRKDIIQQNIEWKKYVMLENADNDLMNQILGIKLAKMRNKAE